MAKYLPLPDGSSMKVPDDMSYMTAMELARKTYPDLFEEPATELAPVKPTVGGQVREFVKGVIPGAIGLVEQAAVGASALLPDQVERATREAIAGAAETLKRPFTPAPGYEETVGRKLGQAVGSTAPFFALGPLGLAGRVGMGALGAGAGAGEARTRAEEEGGMAQRGEATALGAVVGLSEMFAPARILGRVSQPAKSGAVAAIGRALVAGGEEAAQEAASQAAQNLIAKGLYKPDQDIIDQVGESAAYGGAVGALAQGLLDMTLGRRVRGRLAETERAATAEAERQAAEQLEAEKNAPDALRALDAQYQELLTRKQEMEAALVKPPKGATPEEKQTFQEGKLAIKTFTEEEFLPIRREWEQRKTAIEGLRKQDAQAEEMRGMQMEQEMAAQQPTAAAAIPAQPPRLDVQRLMLEQETLTKELQALQTQLQTAATEGRTEDFGALNAQRQNLQRRIDARAALIEEQGGVAVPEAEFQQQTAAKLTGIDSTITKLQTDFAKAAAAGEFDKAQEIAAKIDSTKKERVALVEDVSKRMRSLQEKQLGLEQRGATRPLFTPEEAPTPAAEIEDVTPAAVPGMARKPAEAVSVAAKPVEAVKPAEPTKVQKAEEALRTAAAEKKATDVLQELNRKLQEARAEEAQGVTPKGAKTAATELRKAMEPAVTERGEKVTSPRRIEEAQQRLQETVPIRDRTEDLFSSINLLRTGIQNNDAVTVQKTLNLLEQRKKAEAAQTRAEKDAERAATMRAMDERLGLAGEKVERTATPEEVDSVMADIERLRNQVEKPQRNAKRSILQELTDLAQEHAMLTQALETGVAYKPTMGEKVATLRAKMGKGEAPPAQRQMDASEVYQTRRRLEAITKRYNMLADTRVAPIKRRIEDLYKSLYTRKAVKAPAVERAIKERAQRRVYATKPQGADAFLQAFEKATIPSPGEKGLRALGSVELDLKKRDEDEVYVSLIRNLGTKGKGSAAQALRKIVDLADAHGVTLTLMPEPVGKGGLSAQQLVAWYARAGFRRGDAGMYRRPTPVEVSKIPLSRAAQTAARIARGDVRQEAEASEKMRKLARELGEADPAYKELEANISKRAQALTKRYGPGDKQTVEFNKASAEQLEAKALELGRTAPEYKAVLKEQIEVMREALAETKFSKQTVPSKRTKQVTRKVLQAPRRLLTESPESRDVSKEQFERLQELKRDFEEGTRREREYREFDDDTGTAYRKRGEAGEGQVDAAEANNLIEKVKAELPSTVKFVYAPTVKDVPVRLLNQIVREKADPADVQGAVFNDGTVLVIGENHANLKELEATIAHELVGHYGIDTLIGAKQLQAYADKSDLGKLAREIGGEDLLNEVAGVANTLADMGKSESIQKLQVLREIIAHTEEARVTETFRNKAGRWIKELVGMVRAGLRRMGMMETAKLSTSDIFYMLRNSRKAFADKKIGVYKTGDGETAFRSRKQPVAIAKSFVAAEPNVKDTLFGNFLGLAGRTQFVDEYAAVSKALKTGSEKGLVGSIDAANAEYALRFGKQISQFAGQFLTNGAVQRIPDPKGPKGAYIYKATPGANMIKVAEALNEAGIDNDTQAEAMLTAYVAGLRAKSPGVGWNKLNLSNPALAEREYNDVVAYLNANPKAKTAFEKANAEYQKYNNGLIDFLVQTGEMTKQKAEELKSKPFIPYYRLVGDSVQLFVEKERPIRIGDIKTQPELKALIGGNQQILPIFTSAIQNTFILTRMGLRNQAIKDTAFALQKMGIVSSMGRGQGPAGPNTVRFKVKGEDHFAVIDGTFGNPGDPDYIPAELVMRGLEGIKTTLPGLFNVLGYPADVLRKFVTRAPVYAVRQVIRDPLNAWLTTGSDAVPVLGAFKELGKIMAGRSDAERSLMAMGAISSNVFTGDQRDMEMFLRDITAGKSWWAKRVAQLDQFAMQGDAATRAVVYNDSLAKGMTEQQAALRTLESMNFSRRGLSPTMQALSIMIPFFNAQIQGLDVLYRAFSGQMPFNEQLKVRQKLWTRGLMLAAGTLAYAMMMEDDEAYKRAKPEERLANWFVYVPGLDEPVRVPIPFELGYLFKALPEAIYHASKGEKESEAAMAGMRRLLTQTIPFTLPQAIKPLTEVILGKSFYSGDIESSREQALLGSERYRDTTTGLARLIGSVTGEFGLSPIKIDYLIRGYTGGLGIALTQLANPVVNVVLPKEEVPEPTTKLSKMLFIGGLFQPVEGRGTIDAAYERMKEIKEVSATFKRMVDQGRTADARALAQTYSTEMALVSTSGAIYKRLGEIARLEERVRKSPNLSTEEKDTRLKALDAQKEKLAESYLQTYEKMKARPQPAS